MVTAVLTAAILCLAMILPHLPGRFDGSAAALSFVAQVGSYASLLLVPVGLGWVFIPRRAALWRRLALVPAVLVVVAATLGAAAMDQLGLGLLLGAVALALLRAVWQPSRDASAPTAGARSPVAVALVSVPLILVAFQMAVVPRAWAWSRDRAIQHSAPLIAEIESFRERRGHYPVSLQSLNSDFPTGVVGIERFQYEPSGESYNLFFIRPHRALDAMEVVLFNPRDEHRFTSHDLDILEHDGEQLDLRRGDRRRTPLTQAGWVSILFD